MPIAVCCGASDECPPASTHAGFNADARDKYHHRVEPIDAVERDGKTVVIGKVSGDFPNSPVNLEHVFGLRGEKIASMEIRRMSENLTRFVTSYALYDRCSSATRSSRRS
jgi:hypothetical protein